MVQTDKVNANLLGFDSREREKVDALCSTLEPQAYNRRGNEPPDNHKRVVFGRAHVFRTNELRTLRFGYSGLPIHTTLPDGTEQLSRQIIHARNSLVFRAEAKKLSQVELLGV